MNESWGSSTGGSGSIADESESNSGGGRLSRLVIKVPGYDGNEAVSYLRLGAVPTTEEPGKTLADLVPADEAFVDDDRDRSGSPAQPDSDASGGHGLSKQARKAESAKLHSKGGWRDHSDGNRVTTTTGDKIEVIRGNYKLLVLGRQDDPENGAVCDMSGGLIQQGDIAPGSISEIKWVRDNYSGTWKVIEEAEKGDQKTVYHGDVEEIFYGNRKVEITGAENPAAPIALQAGSAATSVRANPTIIEKTWARSIHSTTGSVRTPVPNILEETYAETTTSVTNAGAVTEHTHAGVIVETQVGGAHIEANATGFKLEAYAGVVIEAYGGLKLELELAGKVSISGPLSVELSWGKSVNLHNLKDEMDVLKTELTATMTTKIDTAKTEISTATDTKISNVETKINTTKTELTSAINTKIGATVTSLGYLKTQLMNAHVLT